MGETRDQPVSRLGKGGIGVRVRALNDCRDDLGPSSESVMTLLDNGLDLTGGFH